MIQLRKILLLLASAAALTAIADDPTGIAVRSFIAASPGRTMFSNFFVNPAMRPLELPVSISRIGASFSSESESAAIVTSKGDGCEAWNLDAVTYIHTGSSTLWGNAGYSNGRQKSVRWNETSDPDIVYPYFSADSIGGDLSFERYSLAGGYADSIGRFVLGASISYDAGLYYRNVDPRPRNVTGRLEASVGAAVGAGAAGNIGIALSYMRYKQTNDIDFVSEMGKTKVYHLTGLGNHYQRFAGNGDESSFDGNLFGLSAQLYPSGPAGFVAAAKISRFTFKKILTGLNSLPLCRAWHNQVEIEAGYKTDRAALLLSFEAWRRHGIENIFGDASSNIYPQIGEIEMYADNGRSVSLTAFREWAPAQHCRIGVKPAVALRHRSTIYAEPASEQLVENFAGSVELSLRAIASRRWFINARAGWSIVAPMRSRLLLPETGALADVVASDYRYATSTVNSVGVRAEASRSVNENISVGLSGSFSASLYKGPVSSTLLDLGINLYF